MMVTFNNVDLGIDLENIKEMRLNGDCAIESNEDFNLGYSYCIDVEDESYWYANEEERNEDLKRLIKELMGVIRKWYIRRIILLIMTG